MKTFQQRLDDKDWLVDENVFSAMVNEGLNPNWTVNSDEFASWIDDMSKNNIDKLLKIMSDKINRQ